MSKLKQLANHGQSIWLDFIRRSYLTAGELKQLVSEGLGGVTSNPTIFEKAIAGSSDYDTAMQSLIEKNCTVQEIYESLAIEDIAMAAKDLRPVYDATDAKDGFVSLEVDPTLANDTQQTIEEAKRLYQAVNHPNVMIKVPATSAGIPAIAELIGVGININVTLIFSLSNYLQVANAYLDGLEILAKNGPKVPGGHPVNRVASVASFFVSRVDTAVDNQLKEIDNSDLAGKIAIANAKVAYKMFGEIFSGSRWNALEKRGARVQRPLWASTGTKNPGYPDTMYVDSLIGADTVNTLPPATMDAFKDHGVVATTITENVAEAERQLVQLGDLGINIDEITRKLQDEGVVAFAKSFESLMNSITDKRQRMMSDQKRFGASLGKYENTVNRALQQFQKQKIASRLWQKDHTIWKDEPTEITNRLGWLSSADVSLEAAGEIESFVDQLRDEGFTHALLLGMGGSSLAPEVFRKTFGVREGYLDLSVLDSTDPAAVLDAFANSNPANTVYIVSTKSGGTVETLSFMKFFYNKCLELLGEKKVGEHFVAITDPGSGLEEMAKSLNFRKIFLNDPDIGGRYSALSFFGIVPAAVIGMNIRQLLERAEIAVDMSKHESNLADNEPLILGTMMGELAKNGRDKLTLVTAPEISAFGAWLEQLIAESTGKEGLGILPVDGEALLAPKFYGNDRVFVYLSLKSDPKTTAALDKLANAGHPIVRITLRDIYDLGTEFFRWEIATAISGVSLKINPFDQPNVESAKISARAMLEAYKKEGKLPDETPAISTEKMALFGKIGGKTPGEALSEFLKHLPDGNGDLMPRGYISIQAYVKMDAATDEALQKFRTVLQKRYHTATTIGYGPRFLHSTGQLHKGDAGNGLFIQITDEILEDAAIPDQPGMDFSAVSFGVLKQSQALGDRKALEDAGREVIRIHTKNVIAAINELTENLA